MELQSGESPHETKNLIRPVASFQRHPVMLHESLQEPGMTPLLAQQQFNYPEQVRYLLLPRETFRRPQQCPPFRPLAELKRGDGACNELPLIGPQNIGKAAPNTAPMQGVMFEMIQPDLEFSSTHAAILLIARHRVCELNRAAPWSNSGGLWRLDSFASGYLLAGRVRLRQLESAEIYTAESFATPRSS